MLTKSPNILISILNWNSLSDTLSCLDSVKKSTYNNYQVIVVDNGSAIDPTGSILTQYPNVTVARNETNLGFTGGHNFALARAIEGDFDYIWLVNNDALVEATTLTELVGVAEENPDIALCGPKIMYLDQPDKIQNCGSYIDWDNFCLMNTTSIETATEWDKSGTKDMLVWGTAVLIRVGFLRTAGLFDERFFAYYEDTDLSVRSIRAGYRNKTVLSAKIFHHSPVNNRFRAEHYHYLMIRNEYIFWTKHLTATSRFRWATNYISKAVLYAASCCDFNLKRSADAALDGLWDAFHGIHGEYALRGAMPKIFKNLILWQPNFLANIVRGDVKNIIRQALAKIT